MAWMHLTHGDGRAKLLQWTGKRKKPFERVWNVKGKT